MTLAYLNLVEGVAANACERGCKVVEVSAAGLILVEKPHSSYLRADWCERALVYADAELEAPERWRVGSGERSVYRLHWRPNSPLSAHPYILSDRQLPPYTKFKLVGREELGTNELSALVFSANCLCTWLSAGERLHPIQVFTHDLLLAAHDEVKYGM
ncbi:hypothetical protein P691DRAFT_787297 [Macrolepiota fuliginosa MF-IS2]|uniref:Uncharacterized protein n=1 Tax=Macrolepiota fuliginosa MF-IS2 TaxID=1400762 RepID=A0A9P6BZW2_9AGAR|nr:hypothetical protein P691DRAFT_787297 [Macrolepiota fuliginosa MF-IS2]